MAEEMIRNSVANWLNLPHVAGDDSLYSPLKQETNVCGVGANLILVHDPPLHIPSDTYTYVNVIESVEPNSPASKAGLRARDIILQVDGTKLDHKKQVYLPAHRVRLTLKFPTQPTTQSIVFEVAPLNSLPHVIEAALNIFHDKSLNGGTFIMSRGHILVFGPVDPHDEENNSRLEQKMVDADLFPEGALLFTEYSSRQPHSQYTVGFNARGPVMYINMLDNTYRHGPESRKDPDPCFARVVEGFDVIQRIAQVPTLEDDSLEYPVYIFDSAVYLN